jgi:O-methyltransferase
MKTGVENKCIQGWFDQTVPIFNDSNEISLLRLDGDWYDSTMVCLVHLFPKVVKGGIIILDDYYTWDGCSRAVHDYLSDIKTSSRIFTSEKGVCYIVKAD